MVLDSPQGHQRHGCVSFPASCTRGARERAGMFCWNMVPGQRPMGAGTAAWKGALGQDPPWPRNAAGSPFAPRTHHTTRNLKLCESCPKRKDRGSEQPSTPQTPVTRGDGWDIPRPAPPPSAAPLWQAGLWSLCKCSLRFFSPWSI